jgi:hypothetical protein
MEGAILCKHPLRLSTTSIRSKLTRGKINNSSNIQLTFKDSSSRQQRKVEGEINFLKPPGERLGNADTYVSN